jgi:hypothetical protein
LPNRGESRRYSNTVRCRPMPIVRDSVVGACAGNPRSETEEGRMTRSDTGNSGAEEEWHSGGVFAVVMCGKVTASYRSLYAFTD